MGFADYVKKAIDVIKLDTSAMKSLAKDQKAFVMGIAMLAIAGVASGIGMLNPAFIVGAPIFIILMSFVAVGILHLLALLFGGKATYTELYHVMAHTAVLNWVMVVPVVGPFLGMLANLWRLVVAVVALETVHGLSRGKAIVIVLIPLIVGIVISLLMVTFMFALLGGMFGGAMMQGMMGSWR